MWDNGKKKGLKNDRTASLSEAGNGVTMTKMGKPGASGLETQSQDRKQAGS